MRRISIRYGVSALVLGAFVCAVLPVLAGKRATGVEFETAKVERGTLRVAVSATGTLSALKTVDVGTQVSGTISKIDVDYNDTVVEGQRIAKIEDTLLKAALMEAEGDYDKAHAELIEQKDASERKKRMFEEKLIAQSEFEAQEASYSVAQGQLKATEARLLRARTNLDYTNIYAPVSGVIISRQVDEGQTVAANFATPTLFTIAKNLKEMRVLVDVDEADVGRIRPGQRARFTVDAYPDTTFQGTVEEVRLQPKVNQNVTTYTVVVGAGNPDLKLLPGMNATVEIVVLEKTNVLKIPLSATQYSPSSISQELPGAPARVWILKDHVPRRVSVATGIQDGVQVEVAAVDLAEGSEVIVAEKAVEPAKRAKTGLLPSPGGPR